MEKKQPQKGVCFFCNDIFTKRGMTKHLESCPSRKQAIETANAEKGKEVTLYHLRIQSMDDSNYWFHLEVSGKKELDDLDSYLRSIWLECCGHMSAFTIQRYGDELDQSESIQDVFNQIRELRHEYDFGTTSTTLITLDGIRQGKPFNKYGMKIMARNLMPEEQCSICDKPATHYNRELLQEEFEWEYYCSEHVEEKVKAEEEELLTPLVNSPRMGRCGYDGPANAPF